MGKKLGIKSVTIRSTGGEGARTGFIEKVKMKKNGKISALKRTGRNRLSMSESRKSISCSSILKKFSSITVLFPGKWK